MPTNRDELRAITMPVGKIATFHPTILPATSDSAENVLLTGRERSFVDCLFFLDYSGGVEELDKSLGLPRGQTSRPTLGPYVETHGA
jgi:hypothetical protein